MIKRIGVIGAGQMGSGIVQVCAKAGYDIRLNDISTEALDRGLTSIENNLDSVEKLLELHESKGYTVRV